MDENKKLLTAAAAAVGLHIEYWSDDGPIVRNGGKSVSWNPLTINSDAFWLAVRLDMLVSRGMVDLRVKGKPTRVAEDARKDPYAATRVAITRAAAASAPQGTNSEAPAK